MLSATNLAKAVQKCDMDLSFFRKNRKMVMQSFFGPFYGYGETGALRDEPINFLYGVGSVFLPALFVRPDPVVETSKVELRPFAAKFQQALALLGEEDRFYNEVRQVIIDSLFGRGIFLTTLGREPTQGFQEPEGYLYDPLRVRTVQIEESDYIEDTQAKTFGSQQFRGHRFRVPYEYARDSGLYDKKALDKCRSESPVTHSRSIWQPTGILESENVVEMVELATVWLPHYGKLVTIPGRVELTTGFLREDDWMGPETGPYDVLSYLNAPGCTLPLSPLAVIYDLSRLMNEVTCKASLQAKAQKDILVGLGIDAAKMNTALRSARQLEFVEGDAGSVKEFSMGGVNPKNYEAVNWFRTHLNRVAGNPDLLGGLSQQADTLGQERLLMGSAQGVVGDRRGQVMECLREVMKKRAFYMFSEPGNNFVRDLVIPLGNGLEVPETWGSEREGNWKDYRISVFPNTAKARGPEEQYQWTLKWITEVVLPMYELAQGQGYQIDPGLIASETGRQAGVPFADDIFTKGEVAEAPSYNTNKPKTQDGRLGYGSNSEMEDGRLGYGSNSEMEAVVGAGEAV